MRAQLLSLPAPSAAQLQALTQRVEANNRWPEVAASAAAASTMRELRGKVRHVIYIIKENRSYDEMFGDLEKGNGDPALTILPEPLSPNHHQLARQFVTLDEFHGQRRGERGRLELEHLGAGHGRDREKHSRELWKPRAELRF